MKNILLTILGLSIVSFQSFAAAKKYIVTVNSPQMFKQIQAHQKGFNTFGTFDHQNNGFHFLSEGPQKLTKTLDNLEMLVVETENAKDIEVLKASGVVEVEEEVIFPEPKPLVTFSNTKGGINNGPLETPWGINAVKAPEAWSGSSEGMGARVLVLDTGIDRDHPALKSRFEKGANFMEREDEPEYEYKDVNGHGTHVAGTIAADGVGGGLVGVAPKATILSGRVCSGGCSSIAIISGVDWGISEKVDVINMSLGGASPSIAAIKAYKRAEAANIVVVAASGNDGDKVQGKISFPAAYDTTYAVGAIDSHLNKAGFSQWSPELNIVAPGVDVFSSVPQGSGRDSRLQAIVDKSSLDLASAPMTGSGTGEFEAEVVFAGLGKPEDVSQLDLTGKIALIQRGEISFKDKADNALNKGAVAVVVYNNELGIVYGTLGDEVEYQVPILGMSKSEGEALKSALENGSQVTLLVAVDKKDYAVFQGTSMATPHVAGVAALVRAANPTLSAKQVRDILSETASPLAGPNDENQLGAGLVNAEAAVEKALLETPEMIVSGTN
ncbi:MAG: S8 family serine peptidase [Bdellovibrionales bacterium]|nr:S8 family serine peptidase [Bdellovibrionales bacterium]